MSVALKVNYSQQEPTVVPSQIFANEREKNQSEFNNEVENYFYEVLPDPFLPHQRVITW